MKLSYGFWAFLDRDFMEIADRIKGALVGMMYGDSFGVPGELWPVEKLRARLGEVNDFMDGPQDNIVACYFKKGEYTDDTSQALVVLNLLLKHERIPSVEEVAHDLIAWVESLNGFEINLLGPSSKATLLAHKNHQDYKQFTKNSLTNGAAMRIAPVGCMFDYSHRKDMVEAIAKISSATHYTDVALAGASMVAQAVCSYISGRSDKEVLLDIMEAHDYSWATFGERTWAASCKRRFQLAIDKADSLLAQGEISNSAHVTHASAANAAGDADAASATDAASAEPSKLEFDASLHTANSERDKEFMRFIYEVIGTGTMTSESVPAALGIAYYCKDPNKAAHMCANLGGDTDTIGAMAVAICGARGGFGSILRDRADLIERVNHMNFDDLVAKVLKSRPAFNK